MNIDTHEPSGCDLESIVELEAKFSILNETAYQSLATGELLAGFAVRYACDVALHDTYLDTPENHMRNAGYACRHRREGTSTRLTLKSLSPGAGCVHRREELELVVDRDVALTPAAWPASPLRDRVLSLTRGEPVLVLFTLEQHRRVYHLQNPAGVVVAEMALDQITMGREEMTQQSRELEIELTAEGTEEELNAMVAHLMACPGLAPQPQSKFERALAFQERSTVACEDTHPALEEMP